MLLVREQMDLPHAVWSKDYLTYKNQIVGFAAPKEDSSKLDDVDKWLMREARPLRAFTAGVSVNYLRRKRLHFRELIFLRFRTQRPARLT